MVKLHWESVTKFRIAGITLRTVRNSGDIALPPTGQPKQLFDRNGETVTVMIQEVRQNGQQSS